MRWILLWFYLLHEFLLCHSVEFIFPGGTSHGYTGYIWDGATKVHLSPHLQATPTNGLSRSGELCEIRIYESDGRPQPFYTKITDKKNGFADVLYDKNVLNIAQAPVSFVLSLEAYDCDSPPHSSERVPLTIHVIQHEGPIFDQPSYRFTVSQQSHKGTVVGTVQAIPQLKENEDAVASSICNYELQPLDAPFSVDRYGVIRVQEKLIGTQPYSFRVVAEDCRRPIPRKSFVDVIVKQIEVGCQPGWKGVPAYLEYTGGIYTPGNLLSPYQLKLETCAGNCPDATIEASLELKSALSGQTLQTATSMACLHDPEHLRLQRSICDIHPNEFTNLLPDPDKDIVGQLTGPPLGNLPRLLAPNQKWRFEAQSKSVWEIDSRQLQNDTQLNAFDAEFSIAFWLTRVPGVTYPDTVTIEDKEETILCSQDQEENNWRYFSVSFRECRLIVRLMASLEYEMNSDSEKPRKATVWMFGPLPEEYCRSMNPNQVTWHHYAITFSRSPWAATSELVSLLIDGQDLGVLGVPIETVLPSSPPYIPSEKKAKPRITVGACYDPATHLTRQHLNGELAGLTVFLGKPAAPNKLRCLAQCGESLLVPDVMRFLREDITVNLTNNAITVFGKDVEHIADILRAVAYIRTQPKVSPDFTASVAQARKLTLATRYSCSQGQSVAIPSSDIQLYIPKLTSASQHDVEVARPVESGSQWVPQSPVNPDSSATKDSPVNMPPPSLLIQGSDIIITELPINDFGIPLFSDVRFVLPADSSGTPGQGNAGDVLLDNCHVWITSSGNPLNERPPSILSGQSDERIEWSLAQVASAGLAGKSDRYGVQLSGRKPAGDYEKVLHTLHYIPPKSLNSEPSSSEYAATIGLMCSLDYGQQTSQFYVKVLIESPESAQAHLSNKEEIEKLSPDPQQQAMPHLAQSDEERRVLNDQLRPLTAEKSAADELHLQRSARAGPFLIVGIVVAVIIVLVVIVLVVLAVVRMRRINNRPRPTKGRRFPSKPADFGGANLKQDPTLRLTANPVGEMEYTGLGTVSENLYGSYRNLAPTQCIYSPPTHHRANSMDRAARLAELDEFDEDFMDQADEQFADGEDYQTPSDRSSSHGVSPRPPVVKVGELYRAGDYGVDVHEWMDDEPERISDSAKENSDGSVEVWDLVSHRQPSEKGSKPVDV